MTIESGGTRTAWRRVTGRRDQKIAHRAWGTVTQERRNIQGLRVDHQLTPLDVFPLLFPPVALYSFHLSPPFVRHSDLTYSTRFYSIVYPFTSLHFHISHTYPPPPYTAHPVELETCNCIPIIHSLTTHPSRPASITHTTLLRDVAGFLCPDDRKKLKFTIKAQRTRLLCHHHYTQVSERLRLHTYTIFSSPF